MNTYCVILNAVYYVFYLIAVHLDNMIARAIYFPFYVFIKYCLPSHINGKYLKRLHETNDLGYKLFRNPQNGLCINWANVFFWFVLLRLRLYFYWFDIWNSGKVFR